MEWIKLSDQIPQEEVLATDGYGEYLVGYVSNVSMPPRGVVPVCESDETMLLTGLN